MNKLVESLSCLIVPNVKCLSSQTTFEIQCPINIIKRPGHSYCQKSVKLNMDYRTFSWNDCGKMFVFQSDMTKIFGAEPYRELQSNWQIPVEKTDN